MYIYSCWRRQKRYWIGKHRTTMVKIRTNSESFFSFATTTSCHVNVPSPSSNLLYPPLSPCHFHIIYGRTQPSCQWPIKDNRCQPCMHTCWNLLSIWTWAFSFIASEILIWVQKFDSQFPIIAGQYILHGLSLQNTTYIIYVSNITR